MSTSQNMGSGSTYVHDFAEPIEGRVALLGPLERRLLHTAFLTTILRDAGTNAGHIATPTPKMSVRANLRWFARPLLHFAYSRDHGGRHAICRAFPVDEDEVATADAQAVVRRSYSGPVVRPVRVELEHRSKLDRPCLHNEHLGSPFLRVDRLDDDMSL